MAAQFVVNITISAGADFTQEFTVANPDGTPVNITGYKFFANLAKHPTAIDAVVSPHRCLVAATVAAHTMVS